MRLCNGINGQTSNKCSFAIMFLSFSMSVKRSRENLERFRGRNVKGKGIASFLRKLCRYVLGLVEFRPAPGLCRDRILDSST